MSKISIAAGRVKDAHKQDHGGESLKAFARRIAVRNETLDGAYTVGHWAAVWLGGTSMWRSGAAEVGS